MKSSQTSSKPLSKTASKPGKEIRLNRFLASCSLGSRRKVEELILAGKISINGAVCTDLAIQVNPERDEIRYENKVLQGAEEAIYLILNKPLGYVVSRKDEYDRKTVYDLLPERYVNLPYAGRLDKNSEGLLLFTNDGILIKQLTHPSHKVEKTYRVVIDKKLNRSELQKLRTGVEIEGGLTHSAGVYVKSDTEKSMNLKLVITEGRKRQIRQMIEAVGAKVISLRRLQFGPIQLKDLPVGRWRPLFPGEINALYKETGLKKGAKYDHVNKQDIISSIDKETKDITE